MENDNLSEVDEATTSNYEDAWSSQIDDNWVEPSILDASTRTTLDTVHENLALQATTQETHARHHSYDVPSTLTSANHIQYGPTFDRTKSLNRYHTHTV
jgi:hypothetical protein